MTSTERVDQYANPKSQHACRVRCLRSTFKTPSPVDRLHAQLLLRCPTMSCTHQQWFACVQIKAVHTVMQHTVIPTDRQTYKPTNSCRRKGVRFPRHKRRDVHGSMHNLTIAMHPSLGASTCRRPFAGVPAGGRTSDHGYSRPSV